MPRAACLVACLLPALATAAQPRERWSLAWDLHPQAAEVGYFVLDIRLPGRTLQTRIDGGTQTEVRDVYVDPALQGDGTAVLRACRPNGECSADSNAVALDRTPPSPPTDLRFDGQR